jgi:predicted heme/steroid binding protein
MREINITGKNLDYVLAEMNHDISLLYVIPCVYTRNLVLNHLRDRMSMLEAVIVTMGHPMQLQTQAPPLQTTAAPAQAQAAPVQQIAQGNQTSFTLEELARFDGKNGNPAYVAVNGIVYDVTNNAAWAAATHFGLAAGKDLTGAFSSCHAGQPVLNKLKVVGMLETRN